MKSISVVGLGKLGAPMAAIFSAKGFKVVGVDLNEEFVNAINNGLAPVQEPNLQSYIDAGRMNLRATTDIQEAVLSSDVSFVIVPTPSGTDYLFRNEFVLDAVEKIGLSLRNKNTYHLVVITSTVVPGSTNGVIREVLEKASGKQLGPDMGLCYNPEFIALGSVVRDMLFPDMLLIGESDKIAGDILQEIYSKSVESKPEVHRMNLINAELCKISVNTFVTTKISYANMIADMCDHLPGADAHTVTRAVGADSRIGRKYLTPATGYGGPCFPRDNKAFAAIGNKLGVRCDLAEATDAINEYQPERIVKKITETTRIDGKVAILGLSYKPDTPVIEESQGITVANLLAANSWAVSVFDPLANGAASAMLHESITISGSLEGCIAGADCIVIMTPSADFRSIRLHEAAEKALILDPWRIVQ